MDIRKTLAFYSCEYSGSWEMISCALKNHLPVRECRIKDPYITIFDDNYPDAFRKLRYPPWVLFYQGDLSLLAKPAASIVGSRDLTDYGFQTTQSAAGILKKRFVLVSGLARGADAAVHRCALENGRTIGIIGSGLGVSYPPENSFLYAKIREEGLILSEYPHDTGVRRYHFPWRNRLIAALGEFLVVTQASEHSGTMLTVNEALYLSKDIYCFPYPFNDPFGKGCNKLIAEGAIPVYDMLQLAEIMPAKHQ